MPLVDATTAKLHLRVDNAAEDTLITIWLAVADQQVAQFLNRNVYADLGTLNAATAAAPAALATATTAYETAVIAAELLDDEVDREAALKYAEEAYTKAQNESDRAQRGIVVNDTIKAAILLTMGELYEHRGETSKGLPEGAMSLLMPYRVWMGI